MEEKFLPIGTVVLLKGAKRNVMITSYFISADKEKKVFEYGGCPWPIGVQKDLGIGFNHDEIEKVVYMGYNDDEMKKVNEYLNENEEKLINEIKEKMSKQ